MLRGIASLTFRRPRLVLACVAVVAVVAGALGHDVERHLKAAGFTDAASESERATALLRGTLGYDANPGIAVLIRARDGRPLDITDLRTVGEVRRLAEALRGVRYMGRVVSPLEDPTATPSQLSRDGRALVLTGHLSTQDIESDGGEAAEEAAERLRSDVLDVRIGGFAPSFDEVNDQTKEDLTNAELIAFPALTVLLLLVFRGVIAAAIPLLIGVLSILMSLLVLRTMSAVVDTSLFAMNIATALSLGLAVDYALLMVTRYREELARDGPTERAHRSTVLTAGRTALFSGVTVAASMAALIAMPQRFLYSVGAAGAAVGILSALVTVLVVPSLLAILGPRIDMWSVRAGPSPAGDSGGWFRLARAVMRRPVLVSLASIALLLGLSVPVLGATLTGPSAEVVPPGKPSYVANAGIERAFGRGLTEGATVTVRGRVSDAGLRRLRARIAAIPGTGPATDFLRIAPTVAFANVAMEDKALLRRPQDAVDAIRALPAAAGTDVLVSGNTARFMDQKQSFVDHLPVVAGIVVLVTMALLFALTGSVLLPLKTLLMNLMTLGATMGILVLCFQHGLLTGALDYTGPPAIEVTSLVFLFAVVFGLATDYAVLVMARIKEQVDRGVPNDEAVAIGIGRTGRVISAAALMIAVVFAAFAVSSVFFMKQLAIGQAIGVIIDATIVRALLVPSLMRLLGGWNWWAPGPLRRLHARVRVEH